VDLCLQCKCCDSLTAKHATRKILLARLDQLQAKQMGVVGTGTGTSIGARLSRVNADCLENAVFSLHKPPLMQKDSSVQYTP
jgi:hypothetical protein